MEAKARKDGFYPVRYLNTGLEIMRWDGTSWWSTWQARRIDEGLVDVLGPRIAVRGEKEDEG